MKKTNGSGQSADLIAAGGIVAGGQRSRDDAGDGVCRMDKKIVPNINAQMADITVPGIETEQIARLKI